MQTSMMRQVSPTIKSNVVRIQDSVMVFVQAQTQPIMMSGVTPFLQLDTLLLRVTVV